MTLVLGWPATLYRCRDPRPSRIPFVSALVHVGRPCWQYARPKLGRILATHRERLRKGSNCTTTATIRGKSTVVPTDAHVPPSSKRAKDDFVRLVVWLYTR